MKIFYLAYSRIPTEKAHGLQIMRTCEALSTAGAEVTLVVPNRKNPIQDEPFAYYGVKKNFALEKVQGPDFVEWGWYGFVLSLVAFAERAHFDKRFWTADVVYSRDALILIQYILLGRSLVYEAHAAPTWLSVFVAKRAKHLIVITQSMRDAFVARGVPAHKVTIAHDGVEMQILQKSRADLGMPDGIIVSYAGSTLPGKGTETLREAVPHIAGTVLFISGKSPGVAQQMLAVSDVVVVPNSAKNKRWSTFSSPLKLFEALASGAAVVASDVPALREVVDESAVWFFTPDDPQSLADAVARALSDPEKDKKVAHAREVAKRYSWSERARTICASLIP